MLKPTQLKPLDHYRLWVRYSDGVEGIVDFSDLAGKGVFALWNDYHEFQKAHIGANGEIAWNDQVEICSDSVYLKITGKRPEDIFPKLQETSVYA
jgi:hypothetical protein